MKIAYIDLNTDIDKEIKKVKFDIETAGDSVYEA